MILSFPSRLRFSSYLIFSFLLFLSAPLFSPPPSVSRVIRVGLEESFDLSRSLLAGEKSTLDLSNRWRVQLQFLLRSDRTYK